MFRRKTNGEKGITAVELLIIASIVALVAVFATPMLSNAIFRSEFQEAVNITEASIDRARETAKFYKTDVVLHFGNGEAAPQNVIRITIPEMQKNETMNEVGEEFLLPAGTELFAERSAVSFDAKGEPEPPGLTIVVFNTTKDKRKALKID